MPPNPKPKRDALRRRVVGTDLKTVRERATSVTLIGRLS
jgi:hypothetical protein